MLALMKEGQAAVQPVGECRRPRRCRHHFRSRAVAMRSRYLMAASVKADELVYQYRKLISNLAAFTKNGLEV